MSGITTEIDTPDKDNFSYQPSDPEAGKTAADDTESAEHKPEADPAKTETKPGDDSGKVKPADEKKESKPDGEGKAPDDEKKTPAGVQKRINRAVGRQYAAEKEAEKLRKENADLKAKLEKGETPAEEPKVEDYENYDDYVDARIDWKNEQRAGTKTDDDEGGDTDEGDTSFLTKRDQMIAEGTQRHDDFEETIGSKDLTVTQDMLVTLLDSEHDVDIAYYLGKHPAEAARIAALPPLRQAAEIGIIEAQFQQGTDTPTKKTTGAPPPRKPVNTSTAVGDKDLSDMGNAEYRAARGLDRRGMPKE